MLSVGNALKRPARVSLGDLNGVVNLSALEDVNKTRTRVNTEGKENRFLCGGSFQTPISRKRTRTTGPALLCQTPLVSFPSRDDEGNDWRDPDPGDVTSIGSADEGYDYDLLDGDSDSFQMGWSDDDGALGLVQNPDTARVEYVGTGDGADADADASCPIDRLLAIMDLKDDESADNIPDGGNAEAGSEGVVADGIDARDVARDASEKPVPSLPTQGQEGWGRVQDA